MKIKIITDSAANVRTMEGVCFASVPLTINTAKAEYVDNEQLDVAQMVAQIQHTKGKSGTSCPNIQDWLNAFDDADVVYAVTITSGLSGSCAACQQAAWEYTQANPERKVWVVDSLSAGPEMALILEKLQQCVEQGMDFEQVRTAVTEYMTHSHLLFSLESLTNLARNGRVNPAVAAVAGVLGIRVVGKASAQGTLQQLYKCRGEKKALQTIWKEMCSCGFTGGKVRIAHCFNPAAASQLTDLIRAQYPQSDVQTVPTTGLCSFYAEQGGLLVGFED